MKMTALGQQRSSMRGSERYRLEFPASIWELGKTRSGAVRSRTGNISRTGLYLQGEFPLRPGAMISFEVQLPGVDNRPGSRLIGQATVVRQDKAGENRCGIGAIIHQYEIQPAEPLSQSPRNSHPNKSSMARLVRHSEKERRAPDRRKKAASSLSPERRHRARRARRPRRTN